jgi:DedD protein
MDRRVKERLIGASILVALAVLVVPELLSGPKPNAAPAPTLPAAAPEPIRNVTVDLTTSKAPANSEPEPAPPQAAAASASTAFTASTGPAANSPAAQIPAPSPVPVPAPPGTGTRASTPSSSPAAKAQTKPGPVRRAAVESTPVSPTSSGHGSWSVQLGSFASRANADNLTRQIKGQGFSVFVLAGGSGNSLRYRVRVGPLSDRESAERMAAKLKSLGHAGSLVSPAA